MDAEASQPCKSTEIRESRAPSRFPSPKDYNERDSSGTEDKRLLSSTKALLHDFLLLFGHLYIGFQSRKESGDFEAL